MNVIMGTGGVLGVSVLCYLDDCVIFSKTWAAHVTDCDTALALLEKAGLKAKPSKIKVAVPKLPLLGHVVSSEGVEVNPETVRAAVELPVPRSAADVRSVLGLFGFYRRFVKDYSEVAHPLTSLLVKDVQFVWGSEQQAAFDDLKGRLTSAPILVYPDFTRPFLLKTDASDVAAGAILAQPDDDKQERVLAYASKKFSPAETRYCTTERECLGVVWGIGHFHQYLYGRHFTVITDHAALKWMQKMRGTNSRLERWSLKLQEYDYTVVHRPGKEHSDVDALSRYGFAAALVAAAVGGGDLPGGLNCVQ